MSCRLICWSCKEVATKAKDDAKAKAEAAGLHCVDAAPADEDEEAVEALTTQYTFMAHNSIGLSLMPFSIGKRGKDKKLPGVQRTRTCRMCGDTESCPGRFGGAHNCTEFDV